MKKVVFVLVALVAVLGLSASAMASQRPIIIRGEMVGLASQRPIIIR